MTSKTRGIIISIISGISFGLIPLFSIPVLNEGMGNASVLIYRFLFGSLAMLVMLLLRKTDMRISLSEFLRIAILSVFYIGTALSTLKCYHYLSSGIATALIYTDPIFCAVIGMLFLGERFSWTLTSSVILATLGVMMMTGVFTEDGTFSAIGLFWGLLSGLSYALYLIFVPRMKLRRLPSLKLTFYVFFIAMLLLVGCLSVTQGEVELAPNVGCWINLLLLGLIPTALSCIFVTMSLRLIDSTIVAILGAFEPLTAIVVGIIVFGDPCSFLSMTGAFLILLAVAILTVIPKFMERVKSVS